MSHIVMNWARRGVDYEWAISQMETDILEHLEIIHWPTRQSFFTAYEEAYEETYNAKSPLSGDHVGMAFVGGDSIDNRVYHDFSDGQHTYRVFTDTELAE